MRIKEVLFLFICARVFAPNEVMEMFGSNEKVMESLSCLIELEQKERDKIINDEQAFANLHAKNPHLLMIVKEKAKRWGMVPPPNSSSSNSDSLKQQVNHYKKGIEHLRHMLNNFPK